jgi:Phage capsid protein
MSVNLASVAAVRFSDMVKPIYQQSAKLSNANVIKVVDSKGAGTYQFQRGGIIVGYSKASSELITPANVTYAKPLAILGNVIAAEYTDIFDQNVVSFQEEPFLIESIGNALARRSDQKIIDVMASLVPSAGTAFTPGANQVLGDGTIKNTALVDADIKVLDIRALITMNGIMNRLGVPNSDRCLALNSVAIDSLMSNSSVSGVNQVTSGDYNSTRVLVNGQLESYLGFKIIQIGDRPEGGMPLITPTAVTGIYGFAFHKNAIGMAVGIPPRIEVSWQPERTSWLTNGIVFNGCTVIDPNGIVKLVHKNSIS